MASLSERLSRLQQKLEVPHPPDQPRPTWLLNNDIRPIEKARRTWGSAAYFSLWSVVAFNMSNFQAGGSLLAVGLNWWQTILATLVGHILAAILLIFSSYPGLEYHLCFTVATRVAWGFCGTVFVVLNRIVLSIIWFGVQSWQGGLMTYVCLRAIWPSIDNIPNTIPASTGMTLPQFVGFIVYFVIQLPFLLLDPKRVRYLLYSAAIGGFFVQLVLVSWACGTRGKDGFGDVLSSGTRLSGKTLGWMFVYGVTVTMSTITSGTASVCDYTRFARRPSSATWSQGMGALPAWLSNIFGVLTIAATQKRYGSELWSVASLLIAIQTADSSSATRVAVFFCGLFFGISQLALNIAGNSFSGGTDMATLLPRYINIRRGQYITAILGLVINPWYLLSGAVVFISVMSAYTVFIQPFLGILVAQYFIVQRRRLKVADLYVTGQKSIYWYTCGVNWRAVVAWCFGTAPHVAGLVNTVNPSISVSIGASRMYYLCGLTAFFIPFAVLIALDSAFPVRSQKEFISSVSIPEARSLYEDNSELDGQSVDSNLGTAQAGADEKNIAVSNAKSANE